MVQHEATSLRNGDKQALGNRSTLGLRQHNQCCSETALWRLMGVPGWLIFWQRIHGSLINAWKMTQILEK